ncbi:MAG: cytochrome bc complex cytochrome b subunit [SAR86 cluster bacterium]|nr:cytochrome bc complex cytochrome b subunit [SAR86 cluster bacterium]
MFKKILYWFDQRLPITATFERHLSKYPAPLGQNFWYLAGVLLIVVFVIQFISGIWLVMGYEPTEERAFASIQYIMRDVNLGWIIRYMHTTGASAFFLLIYLHMFRGMLYGSYQKPRELLWVLGWITYIILVAEGFTGYVLPWGQMSFWAAQVIFSLLGAIPIIGEDLLTWIRGDYLISGITLSRLFAFHVVLLPILLAIVVFVHILALHEVGSNNPEGIDVKQHIDENGVPLDTVPFFPYDVVKDLYAIGIFLTIFCFVLFFFPDGGGYLIEYINYELANNLKTPEHIVPAWYYTTYYAMLRAITFPIGPLTAKFLGFVVMVSAMVIFALLPWLDKSPVKSIRYKGMFSKAFLYLFVVSFIVLGYLGSVTPNPMRTLLAQIFTMVYFAYFLLMPFYTKYEKCKPVPERIKIK